MLNSNKAQRYVVWLKGFLDATGNTLTDTQVITMKSTLDSIFEHEAKKEVESKEIKKSQTSDISYYDYIPSSSGIFPSERDTVLRC